MVEKIENFLDHIVFTFLHKTKIIPSRHSLNTNTIIRLGTILPSILPSFQLSTKSSHPNLKKNLSCSALLQLGLLREMK